MKYKHFTAIAISAMAILSCSTDTDTLGSSLTNESDKVEANTGFFQAYTRSVLVDSVYARNYDTYFGRVRDPETGAYVKTEFMAQFNLQEGLKLPTADQMTLKDDQGKVVAKSCEIWLAFDKSACYGDSLSALKMNVLELNKPMSEKVTYYSNYDPRKEGYIREDGLKKSVLFSQSNLTFSDSVRKNTSGYFDYIRVSLSDEYTDKQGNTYNNYGTYLLRNYYEHPEYFKNAYTFTTNLCPGFFFELADGLGLMAKFSMIELRVFYEYQKNSSTTSDGYLALSSTPEVLQTTQVTNDKTSLARLVEDQTCTYLKAPSGIFTEVSLPIDEIVQTHAADSLLSVNITFQRQNSGIEGYYLLSAPSNIMMVPTDSLKVFFEEEKSYDYKSAFMSTLSTTNSYNFSNIGNLITLLSNRKKAGVASDPDWVNKHPNWNKVLLLPIAVTTVNSNNTESVIENQMGLVSTKLMGGINTPIDVKVIYARFRQ
jgi:hypothetical protein